ncbi:MAG: hypothetical protein JSS51_01405 [Planctomycetes bacterium]|nr:hypothetical protein [Planctomycetota bacterium]
MLSPIAISARGQGLTWSPESGWGPLPPRLRASWATAYPRVDLEIELARASAWLVSNQNRRIKDLTRFVNSWLSKAAAAPAPKSAGGFDIAQMLEEVA